MPSLRDSYHTVLVVDDDPAILELVGTRLTLAGYMVLKARNGRDALARLSERRYDAMVLDLNMPEVDGFEVLDKMKALDYPAPATLVLTASHNSADVARAVKMGARDYLAKPFEDRQLLMRVSRLFRVQGPKMSAMDELESLLDLPI